ncbi:MAG: hypothetical protein ACLQU2_33510 [Candidatus Binataceae bacterium]
MTVNEQVFSGKGAREEAARALVSAVLSRRDDHTLRKHAAFKGFEILSRGQPAAPVPDLFMRAREPTARTSTPAIPSAPCKASSTRCAPSIVLPRTNETSSNG